LRIAQSHSSLQIPHLGFEGTGESTFHAPVVPGGRLELESRGKLQHAWPSTTEARIALRHIRSRCDLSKTRSSERVARQGKLWVIEYVEYLGSNLQIELLGQLCVLRNGEIDVPKTRTIDCVPAEISESRVRHRKGIRIQIACDWSPIMDDWVHAWHNIRSLVIIRWSVIERWLRVGAACIA